MSRSLAGCATCSPGAVPACAHRWATTSHWAMSVSRAVPAATLLTPDLSPTDREGHPAAAGAGGTEERTLRALQALVHGGQSP